MNKQGYTKLNYIHRQRRMDKQLTSQVVGREFVRQYYTVLHESPLEMHRFYNDKSSYLHGGDEQAGHELPPVCGQKVSIYLH